MADVTTPYNANANVVTGAGGSALLPVPNPTGNQPVVPILPTAAPTTTTGPDKTSPVITAAPATANLQTIQNNTQAATTAIQGQSLNLANVKANMAITDAQNKAAADALALKNKEIDSKNNIANAVSGVSQSTPIFNSSGQQVDQNGKVISGAQTQDQYNNIPRDIHGNPITNSSNTTTQSGLGNELADVTAQQDQAWNNFQSTLQQYQSGTIPLTANQQSLITSMNQLAEQAHNAQLLANKNYEGGVATLQGSLGLTRYAPDMALGAIQKATSDGITKIQDLDAKAAQALAQVTQGFEDSNFKQAQSAYNAYTDYLKQKQQTIVDVHNSVQKEANDLKTYQLDLAKFQETVSKNEADLTGYTTDEKGNKVKTVDYMSKLFDQNYKIESLAISQGELKLKQQAAAQDNQLFGNGSTAQNPVTTGADGKPDPAQQAAFLATLPQMTQTWIKGLTDYSLLPSNLPARTDANGVSAREKIIALAKQYDPTYNDQTATQVQKVKNDFTSGKSSQNVNSLNTTIGHLSELAKDFQSLPNANITKYNSVKDYLSQNFGSGATTAVRLDLAALTGELATTFKGGGRGATDNEIAIMNKGFGLDASPTQFQTAIQTAVNLMGSRLGALQDTFEAGAGVTAPKGLILHNNTVQTLSAFKDAGYQVNIPGIPFSNSQSFYKASPTNAAVWNDTLQQMQSLEQQGLLDSNKTYAPNDILKSIYLAHPELLDANIDIPTAPSAQPIDEGRQLNQDIIDARMSPFGTG